MRKFPWFGRERVDHAAGKSVAPGPASPEARQAHGEEVREVHSAAAWHGAMSGLAEGLPWFGEGQFAPAPYGRPPRSVLSHTGYVRRVLLSWLAGRPVSEVAARAGCGSRLVYEVVEAAIYLPDPADGLRWWSALGLVGVVDTPRYRLPSGMDLRGLHGLPADPGHAQVFCLVCHRHIAALDITDRSYDGTLLRPGRARLAAEGGGMAAPACMQAHLMLHFRLERKLVRRDDSMARALGMAMAENVRRTGDIKRAIIGLAALSNVDNRQLWTERVSGRALDIFTRYERVSEQDLAPVSGGQVLDLEEASGRWRRMLGQMSRGRGDRPIPRT